MPSFAFALQRSANLAGAAQSVEEADLWRPASTLSSEPSCFIRFLGLATATTKVLSFERAKLLSAHCGKEERTGEEWELGPSFYDKVEKGTVCRYAAPDHLQKPYLAIQLLQSLKKGRGRKEGANARCLWKPEGPVLASTSCLPYVAVRHCGHYVLCA